MCVSEHGMLPPAPKKYDITTLWFQFAMNDIYAPLLTEKVGERVQLIGIMEDGPHLKATFWMQESQLFSALALNRDVVTDAGDLLQVSDAEVKHLVGDILRAKAVK